jgi:hypothetical protein
MGNPRAVETVVSFPLLVPAPFVESDGSGRLVTPIRYERGHAADRVRAAAVAGADEQVGYARMNGVVMVTAARSGSTKRCPRVRKFLIRLNM